MNALNRRLRKLETKFVPPVDEEGMRRVREIHESRRRRLAAEGREPEPDPWPGDEISHGPISIAETIRSAAARRGQLLNLPIMTLNGHVWETATAYFSERAEPRLKADGRPPLSPEFGLIPTLNVYASSTKDLNGSGHHSKASATTRMECAHDVYIPSTSVKLQS